MGLIVIPVDDLTIERMPIDPDAEPDRRFDYCDLAGGVSGRRLRQIENLAIPPAWQNVRVAPQPKAHLQAVGVDGQGRTQYIYHEIWPKVRDEVKAARLLNFGKALPVIREHVARDMELPLTKRRAVVATAIRLIDDQLMRVGGEQYARNGTRGASTLTNSNARVRRNGVEIKYRGKGGKQLSVSLRDKALRKKVQQLKKRPGRRLFSYPSRSRQPTSIRAGHINEYLAKASGLPITAKDFRTYAASSIALKFLCEPDAQSCSSPVSDVSKLVAKKLRNTPTVARTSYIHPYILNAFEQDNLDRKLIQGRLRNGLSKAETALMRFLENHTLPAV